VRRAIVILVLLAACAQKDKGPTPDQVAHQQYVAKVNVVCGRYRWAELPEIPDDPRKLGPALRTVTGWIEGFAHDIRAVPPPATERAEVEERLWAPVGNLVRQMRSITANYERAVRSGADEELVRRVDNAVQELFVSGVGTDAWLNDFGLAECTDD
jgi:hypothetical protein